MVAIIREADRDSVAELSKRHGVSEQTIYVWRKRFGELKLPRFRGVIEGLADYGSVVAMWPSVS
jgi:transposase-like protein